MKPEDMIKVITILRQHGFTVTIAGMLGAEVTISTEDRDIAWADFGETTEAALEGAVRQAHTWLHQVADAIAPYAITEGQ